MQPESSGTEACLIQSSKVEHELIKQRGAAARGLLAHRPPGRLSWTSACTCIPSTATSKG